MKLPLKFLQTTTVTMIFLGSMSAWAKKESMPNREGPRPATTTGIPHMQIGINSTPIFTEKLLQQIAEILGVELRETVMSLPGAKGFWLSEKLTSSRQSWLGNRASLG